MLASLSLIFIVGLAMGAICQKLKLPRIIGILVTGIVLGPYVLDAVSPAVVVPRMVTLMEKKYGTEKAIPSDSHNRIPTRAPKLSLISLSKMD